MVARVFLALMLTLASIASTSGGQATPDPPVLGTLTPGQFLDIVHDVDINVVFVGYEPGAGSQEISAGDFLAELPATYQTVNRYPSFYLGNQFLGLTYHYDYNLVFAGQAFEDEFFAYLNSIAIDKPVTLYQDAYNSQDAASIHVDANAWIDAPSVEQWLANHAGSGLGIDTSQYTIFFVNWYGRSDFRFHVYTKTGEPDPETGYDFGLLRDSRKMIAWGGTTPDDEESGLGSLHRIWFYDLSAGPEAWTDNWNVDDGDLDGNGLLDYRMPPVWEYGSNSGYRPFDDLSGDLGKVARYVALDLLFTTSPLYKPAISPPLLPEQIQLDINVFQIDPNSDGTQFFDLGLLVSELSEVQPLKTFTAEMNSVPFGARFEQVYLCFYNNDSCFGNRLFGIAFGDLFLYFQDHLMSFLEGDGDYEIPIFAFNATDELFTCCLGFADDNWADGTQSFVFGFDSPSIRNVSGYGFTTTFIHEVGHHIGLSHPHDGFDFEANVDYGPGDDFYFAWSGDESNSMMSYIDVNWDFSQFDRDNMNRYLVSTYLNQANVILGMIYKSAKAGQVSSLLLAADQHAAEALSNFQGMEYGSAALHAKLAYDTVVSAAVQINIQLEPQAWPADYKAKGASPKFVDGVDYGPRFDP